MYEKRVLSMLSIIFLLFQLVMPGLGFAVDQFNPTETTKSDSTEKVAVKEIAQDENSITWKVWINQSRTENEGTVTELKLDSGLNHGQITKRDKAEIEETDKGYTIKTEEGQKSYGIEIKTDLKDKDKVDFSIEAITNYSGEKFKASDKALNEGKVERDRVAAEKAEQENIAKEKAEQENIAKEKAEQENIAKEKAEQENIAKEKAEQEKVAEKKTKKKKVTQEKDEVAKDKATEKVDEEEVEKEEVEKEEAVEESEDYVPIEGKIAKSSTNVKFFNAEKRSLYSVDEATVDHNVEPVETDNMCLREVEGTIDINLPAPTEKKPVDIVVVQDASGSYAGNENQVKQSLKDIVDTLDLAQDRMMVTSYRGFDGFKAYNNLTQYYAGNYNDTRTRGSQQKTSIVNHTGLSKNKNYLKGRIDQIAFGGATPTEGGLKYAKEQYAAATASDDLSGRKTVFILITDGVANIQADGNIHIKGYKNNTNWGETNQFYVPTFAKVVAEAQLIKNQGYEMVSAYWENVNVLRGSYPNYDSTIGPAARQMVKDVASSPENYSSNEDLAQSIIDLLASLDTVVNQYDGFKTEFDIAPGFELVPDSIELNSSPATYTQTGNKVTVTKNTIKSGTSKLTYKLRETAVHGSSTIPITNGKISYDADGSTFKQTLLIPNAELVGNPNADRCEAQVKKSVAKGDTNDFTTSIELQGYNDPFTYKLEYQFDEKINDFGTVQLKDELEGVLELIGTANDITIDSGSIQNLGATTTLLSNQSGFTIDIPKKNGSYNYLAGNTITVTFKAKIKEGTTAADLTNYSEQRIPNQGILALDGEVKNSNIVYVQPPKRGTIKITKEDANDSTIKLPEAVFHIFNSNNVKVGELITDEFGVATSGELPVGDYTLVEITAPAGYQIDTTDLSVSVIAGGETQKTIKNKKLKGTIKIIKVDADNVQTQLAGAKFEVFDSAGVSVGILETGADGTITSDELPAGDYTLVEINAPVGYEITTIDLTVTVIGGEETEKTITNKAKKGKVVITKTGTDNAVLEGATFELIDSNGTSVGIKTSNDSGKIIFDNLEWGEYTLKETKAPEGYRLLEREITITIDQGNLLIEKTIKNTKQGWEIPDTGGIGALGFYGLGILLMAIAAWFIFRKRKVQ